MVDAAIFKEDVQEFTKRKRAYRDNSTKIFTVTLGQCSQATKAKLEAREDWEGMKSEHNLVRLLKAIKSLLHNQLQNDRHAGITAYGSIKALFNVRQVSHEETVEYRKRFTAATEVLEHVGVTFGAMFQGMADDVLKSQYDTDREGATDEQATEAERKAGDSVLAIMFLRQSCPARYGEVARELQNDFLKGKDNYPTDITAAYAMLASWRQWSKTRDKASPLDGVAYSMEGESQESGRAEGTTLATSGRKRDVSQMTCNNCGKKSHLWRNCPKPYGTRGKASGATANAMVGGDDAADHPWEDETAECAAADDGLAFCQTDSTDGDSASDEDSQCGDTFATPNSTSTSYERRPHNVLPEGSVGLDSLSTVDLFCDRRMLTNIRKATRTMKIQCNAGAREVGHVGHLAGYGDVWFDASAVANILSLGRVTSRFKVTFNSRERDGFVVHLPDRRTRRFQRTQRGLYASQLLSDEGEVKEVALTIATVEGNKKRFTKREVRDAGRARRLQTALLFPSDRHLKAITESLRDCPITPQDVDNAKSIFGPALGVLKGKTTRSRSVPVTVEMARIPQSVRDRLKVLHLHADICFVNGIGFVVSITDKLKFCTSEAVCNRTDEVLVAALRKIHATYRRGGFRIDVVSLDGEFSSAAERIRNEAQMDVNPMSAGEHVPVIERHIRHLKDGVRGMYQILPFDKKRTLPARMIIELVHAKTFFKNAVPALDGVSDTISPREMVTKQRINYDRHCSLMFGQYVQTH